MISLDLTPRIQGDVTVLKEEKDDWILVLRHFGDNDRRWTGG